MRNGHSRQPADAAALRQMSFNERAMFTVELAKGMECLDHSGSLSPSAANTRRQSDHRGLAIRYQAQAGFAKGFRERRYRVQQISPLNIFDRRAWGQAVLRQPDPAALQFCSDEFVLRALKSV